jgi:hypothetical protein
MNEERKFDLLMMAWGYVGMIAGNIYLYKVIYGGGLW